MDDMSNELFNKLDPFMKVQPKYISTQSLQAVQVGILEKQTIFLTNSGELYGCGASEYGILDSLEGREEDEDGERLTLGFLPDEIKLDCKKFLQYRDITDPQRFTLFKSMSNNAVKYIS